MSSSNSLVIHAGNHQTTCNVGQQTSKLSRARNFFVAVLALGCAFGAINQAQAQNVTPPPTPTGITPPAGNSAFLVGHAFGTQGYVCLPTSTSASWTVNGARPGIVCVAAKVVSAMA